MNSFGQQSVRYVNVHHAAFSSRRRESSTAVAKGDQSLPRAWQPPLPLPRSRMHGEAHICPLQRRNSHCEQLCEFENRCVCVCQRTEREREWAQLCCRVKGTAHGDLETVQMFLQEKRKCIKVLNKITCCQSRLTLMYCVFANAMMPGKCPRPKPWKYEVPAFSYTPNVLVCWSLTYFGENLFQSHRDPLNFTRNRSSLQHQVLGKTFRKIPDHSH